MRYMHTFALALTAGFGATAALAEDGQLDQGKQLVLACMEQVGDTTNWNQCVALTFKPCAEFSFGTDAHGTCVASLRDDWGHVFDAQKALVEDLITPQGLTGLEQLISSWSGYVSQKCNEVSLSQGGSTAAKDGCEVAELVSATSEFVACRAGVSTAPFCELKDG